MGAWFWWMGGVQDRFTLLEVKAMMSGLPGTLATSAINQPIVKWFPFPVLLFSGSHDSYNLYLKLELEYLRVIKIQNLVLYCTIIDLYCTLEACGRWVPFVKKKYKK